MMFRFAETAKLLFALTLGLSALSGQAGPFSPEWNFDALPAPSGKVKTIREDAPDESSKAEYNADGRLIRRTVYHSDRLFSRTELSYDKRGRLVRIEFHLPGEKKPRYIESAEYSDAGLKRIVRSGRDEKEREYTHETSSIALYPDGKVREIVLPHSQAPVIWRWEFDSSGHIASVCVLAGEKNLGVGIYRCDKFGNPTEARRFDPSGLPAGYLVNTYTFDSQGNWIRKETGLGRAPDDIVHRSVTTRRIEYRP